MSETDVLDMSLGMQELEDAAAENQWRNSETYGQEPFSHSVHIGGVMTKKSRAISQQFRYVISASSTDRLRRVAQESRFKTTGGLGIPRSRAGDSDAVAPIDSDKPTLFILQPIATVVACEGRLFLCIAEVNGLFLGHQPVDDIPLSFLSEKTAQVSYQGLRLVPACYSDDREGKHDWRTKDFFRLSGKVPGSLVFPINPDIASHNLCDAFFLFQSSELMAIAAGLRDNICRGHRKSIPQVKPSDHFPYREHDGKSD